MWSCIMRNMYPNKNALLCDPNNVIFFSDNYEEFHFCFTTFDE